MSCGCHATWCRGRRAITPCLSSRCYYDFSISVNFTKSFKLRAYRSCTSLASGLSISRITATHWYASRISRMSPQSAFSVASVVVVLRWCVRVRRACSRQSLVASLCCLGGFPVQLVFPSSAACSRPAVRYILDFPQSSLSLPEARSTASPTSEYSTTVFQVHRGGSNPLSPLFPSSRRRGSVFDQSWSISSVCLTDRPFLAGSSGASYGSTPVCLHHESHREQQNFSYGVDSFFGNDRLTPSPLTCSSDNSLHPSRYRRLYLPCLLSAGVAHLTLGGLRWSPHLLPILCTSV